MNGIFHSRVFVIIMRWENIILEWKFIFIFYPFSRRFSTFGVSFPLLRNDKFKLCIFFRPPLNMEGILLYIYNRLVWRVQGHVSSSQKESEYLMIFANCFSFLSLSLFDIYVSVM